MADLEFVDQHNMVACLEKTGGNSEFHEIVDFLTSSSIHHALTVSPTIYISYIEQFWNTASSQIVNDEKQIHATIDSKAVVVTEASIRSSLLLNDVVGTACLTNEAIFQNLALMGYEGELNKLTFQKALFSPQWKYLIHTILHCLSSKSTSWNEFSTNIASAVICLATNQKFNFSKLIFDGMLRNLDNPKKKFLMYPRFLMVFLNNQIELGEPFNDVYVTPAHTQKVFSNMSRKGVKFSGKVTPLFDSMLVPHQAPEGEGSEQPTEPQPTPSPTQPSTGDQPPVTDSSSSHDTTQDSRDSLEGTNLRLVVLALEQSKTAQDLVIRKLKKKVKKLEKKLRARTPWMKLFKIGTSNRKSLDEEYVSKQERKSNKTKPMFDDSDFAKLDVDNVMENVESDAETQGRYTAEQITINVDTVNTSSIDVSVAGPSNVSTIDPSTSTAGDIFEDKKLEEQQNKCTTLQSQDKGKGKMVELKPTPKNPIKAQIQRDAEIAQRLHEEEKDELERMQRERATQEEASNASLIAEFDNVQARMEADVLLAARLQEKEREQFSIDEQARFLVETIVERKRFFAAQRAEQIRNKPPTKIQLRNKMITYLENMGRFTYVTNEILAG
ncbi:hypothetical protein Tco_0066233 [Tanacetum coccineum]